MFCNQKITLSKTIIIVVVSEEIRDITLEEPLSLLYQQTFTKYNIHIFPENYTSDNR